MTFHIITLFEEAFDSYLKASIIGRAIEDKKIKIKFYNPKDFDRSGKRVDDKPYGGGPGMVIRALPVIHAIKKAKGKKGRVKIIFLSPGGKQFTNSIARTLAQKGHDIIIVCGRYEGIDARVKKIFGGDNFSIGPYILTGGELPAMIIIDTVARQIKGVLGDYQSLEESREASNDVYTRPEVLEYGGSKWRVPKVLLMGHHKRIEDWRRRHGK